MRGINGQPIVDMSRFLNREDFKKLEPEIIAGISETKLDTFEGIFVQIESHPNSTNPHDWKTVPKGLKEFLNDPTIPKDSKVMGWYNDLANVSSRNKLVRFLKSKYGVYDPLQNFYLTTDENFGGKSMPEAKLPSVEDHFPKVMEWANSLVGDIFDSIFQVVVFYVEHDGRTIEHTDLAPDNDLHLPLDKVHDDIDKLPHFVHLRIDTSRPFYVFDPENKNKYFANSWACWFNAKEWHSAVRHTAPAWSLRIDGHFTDKIKKELNL